MSKKKEMMEMMEIGSTFPGFRFSPTEEELIAYYLKKKIKGGLDDKCVEVIAEIDFTQFEPWDLPAKSIIQSDNEWFFFSACGRKYPRGLQSRRATESGYWKATGKERNVKTGRNIIGTKRTLVFHKGRAPKGERTEWIMHEYCMSGTSQDSMVICRLRRNCEFHSHDTRRKEPRQLLTGDSSTSGLADGLLHKGVFEGGKTVDGCYKDCSASDNSHSVDRIDSEFESDHKLANGIFQDGSCSPQKGCDGADDCFADILNDDIVELDESSLSTTRDTTESKVEVKFKKPVQGIMPGMQPFQGTANRRIRLWKQKENYSPRNPVEASEVRDENLSGVVGIPIHTSLSPYRLLNTLSDMEINHPCTVILVILTLLVLFLSLLAQFWQVKDFVHTLF